MDEIKAKLDKLFEYQSQIDVLNLEKKELIDSVLTPEIKAKIADIETEFAGKAEAAERNSASLTAEIKEAVIPVGETVRGDFLMAVWNKGRTSWDTAQLNKAIKLIPALAEYKKEGSPSVSIRKI